MNKIEEYKKEWIEIEWGGTYHGELFDDYGLESFAKFCIEKERKRCIDAVLNFGSSSEPSQKIRYGTLAQLIEYPLED